MDEVLKRTLQLEATASTRAVEENKREEERIATTRYEKKHTKH